MLKIKDNVDLKEYYWDKTASIYVEEELTKSQEEDFVYKTLADNVKGFEKEQLDNYIIDVWKKFFKDGDIGYPKGWRYNFRFIDKKTAIKVKEEIEMNEIRQFNTGANRDTDEEKLDYEGFYSPLVIEAFAKYMHKNRKLKDGSIRDSDNWQNLFGDHHEDVCMKSAFRHFMDLWQLHRGYEAREDIDDAICGIMFNVMAYYHKILKDKRK